MRSLKGVVWVLVCLFLTIQVANAQVVTGTIRGTVFDPTGAVIPGANVTVRSQETGLTWSTTTNAAGEFAVLQLAKGLYSVVIEAQGFRRLEATNIVVGVALTAELRLTLEVGAVAEQVVVSEAQTMINTTDPELKMSVTRRQILGLPLAGRSPIQLAAMMPGFQAPTGARSSRVHGLRGQTTNITQDGINVNDNFVRTDSLFALSSPTVENIGEISVSTGTIGPDSGAGMAQVRLVSQRGSNAFRGSAFYFYRTDNFSANSFKNNFTNTPREELLQHRFGFHTGGRIIKDRTFFFFSYEGFRENFGQTRNRTILTPEARTGTFRYLTCGTDAVPAACTAGQTPTVTVTRNVFLMSSNTFGFNPITMNLVNATPLPNNTDAGDQLNTQGFRFNVNGSDPSNRYQIRLDHKAIDSSRFGAHEVQFSYYWSEFSLFPDTFNGIEAPFPADVAVSCPDGMCMHAGQASQRKVLSLGIMSNITPTMFNEARAGFQRAPVAFLRDNAFPRSFRMAFPLITTPEQNFLDQGRLTPLYTFLDNFSKVYRSHTFKAGFQVSSTSGVAFNDAGIIEQINLGTNTANSTNITNDPTNFPGLTASQRAAQHARSESLYAILTGLQATTSQTFHLASATSGFVPGQTRQDFLRERAYMGYFQDIWRAHSSLTMNYGVRYELVRPVDVVNGVTVQPIPIHTLNGVFSPGAPATIFTVSAAPTFGQVLTSFQAGQDISTQLQLIRRRRLWKTDANNFAPFVGFAFSPNSDNFILKTLLGKGGKGAIRGGFAVSYTRDGITVASNSRVNNTGAQTSSGFSFPTGVVTGPLSPPAPVFSEPVSQLRNFLITGGASNLFTYDANLRTPYVLQWSLGIEREILPQTRLEVRYVGNHAVKLYRGLDLNQPNITTNGMLNEFLIAQTNLACHSSFAAHDHDPVAAGTQAGFFGPTGHACNVASPLLTAMTPPTAFFTSSARIVDLDRDQAGEFTHQTWLAAVSGFFRPLLGLGQTWAGLGTFPANFFRTNPFVLNAIVIGNHSRSKYHGLQVEVFRRFSRGILVQGNYTWAKTMTDFDGASQSEFSPYLSFTDSRREWRRASFDITHTVNYNSVWEFPLGRGRRFLNGGIIGKIMEGWQTGAVWQWRSGRPTFIVSARGTLNRNANSGPNDAILLGGLTGRELCSFAGVNKTGQGPYWLSPAFLALNPKQIGSTVSADLTKFDNPGPGQLGDSSLSQCEGPRFFQADINLIKKTYITETLNLEFRVEFFNLLNNANFLAGGTQNINAAGFGTLSDFGTPREIQFNVRINF